MAASQPPTENLPAFNSTVFKDANTESLSLSKAQSLFLGRTGNPSSVASNTTFTGLLTVSKDSYFNGVRVGMGSNIDATNTCIGNGALSTNSSSTLNTGIGYNALNQSYGGSGNTALGANALSGITLNINNTCVGAGAGTANGIGSCTLIGNAAQAITGSANTVAVGQSANTGDKSVAVGGGANISGSTSTGVGYNAVSNHNFSTVLGYNTVSSANNQVVLGTAGETVICKGTTANGSLVADADIFVKGTIRAGMGVNTTNTTPSTSQQTAFGVGALVANNITAGSTAFGYNALNLYTGQSNFTTPTAVGSNALSKMVIGGYACAVGTNALLNATGTSNNAFGANAGAAITTGLANIFVGGDYPIGGSPSANGNKITTGDNNVFVGQEPTCAGIDTNNSIILGTKCTITGDNAVAIGYQVTAGANEIVLGGTGQTVLAKGTTANGSLVADADIFVKGTIRAGMGVNTTLTTPATSKQTAFGVGALVANNQVAGATAFGFNALNACIQSAGATANTAFGSNALSKVTGSGYNVAVGANALINCVGNVSTPESVANTAVGANAGISLTTGICNTFFGADAELTGNANKITTGERNTFIGHLPTCSGTSTKFSTILGASCTITGDNAVAIGYQVTAGANEIVLGGTGQTVLAKGTGTSITASGAISAVGAVTTTSISGMSARVYNLDEYNATASTPYVGALFQQGDTGALRILNNKAGGGTANATSLYIQTSKSDKTTVSSMIIASDNIQMNLPITLQSTYSAVAAAGQLGNVVVTSSTSFSVTTATAVSFASFSNLPAGVWAFSYTIDLTTAGGTVTATIQSLYMTLTNNGAYSTKVAYGGSTRTHNSIVYAIGDNPCFSSALTYSTTATTSFYPTFLISFTGAGATITANGYATATRIG